MIRNLFLLAVILLLACSAVAETVNFGTKTALGDGESVNLGDTIVYAIDVGGDGVTYNGVVFDRDKMNTDNVNNGSGSVGSVASPDTDGYYPNLNGIGPTDSPNTTSGELNTLMSTCRGDSGTPRVIQFDVTLGSTYRVQILFRNTNSEDRSFDLSVGSGIGDDKVSDATIQAWSLANFAADNLQESTPGVWTAEITAESNWLWIHAANANYLGDTSSDDPNPNINAIIISEVSKGNLGTVTDIANDGSNVDLVTGDIVYAVDVGGDGVTLNGVEFYGDGSVVSNYGLIGEIESLLPGYYPNLNGTGPTDSPNTTSPELNTLMSRARSDSGTPRVIQFDVTPGETYFVQILFRNVNSEVRRFDLSVGFGTADDKVGDAAVKDWSVANFVADNVEESTPGVWAHTLTAESNWLWIHAANANYLGATASDDPNPVISAIIISKMPKINFGAVTELAADGSNVDLATGEIAFAINLGGDDATFNGVDFYGDDDDVSNGENVGATESALTGYYPNLNSVNNNGTSFSTNNDLNDLMSYNRNDSSQPRVMQFKVIPGETYLVQILYKSSGTEDRRFDLSVGFATGNEADIAGWSDENFAADNLRESTPSMWSHTFTATSDLLWIHAATANYLGDSTSVDPNPNINAIIISKIPRIGFGTVAELAVDGSNVDLATGEIAFAINLGGDDATFNGVDFYGDDDDVSNGENVGVTVSALTGYYPNLNSVNNNGTSFSTNNDLNNLMSYNRNDSEQPRVIQFNVIDGEEYLVQILYKSSGTEDRRFDLSVGFGSGDVVDIAAWSLNNFAADNLLASTPGIWTSDPLRATSGQLWIHAATANYLGDSTSADPNPNINAIIISRTIADNLPPVVNAGFDRIFELGESSVVYELGGSVTDPDGDAMTIGWTSSDPANVTFDDATDPSATATFSAIGTYTLTLTANDGTHVSSNDVVIKVVEEIILWDEATVFVDTNVSGGIGDGSDWDNAYDTIQEAIDASSDWDIIAVASGTYPEALIIGNKEISLITLDAVIDGEGIAIPVTFNGTTATPEISGFTIVDGSGIGINCDSALPVIENCTISYINPAYGIFGTYGIYSNAETINVDNCVIEYIFGSTNQIAVGIGFSCNSSETSASEIKNSEIRHIGYSANEYDSYGIYLDSSNDSDYTVSVLNCDIKYIGVLADYGGCGISCYDYYGAGSLIVSECNISFANFAGIECQAKWGDVAIADSDISNCGSEGIYVSNCSGLTLERCSVFDNSGSGVALSCSDSSSYSASIIACDIEGNGSEGVYANGVTMDIDSCNIENNAQIGIYAKGSSSLSLDVSDSTIGGNGIEGIYAEVMTTDIIDCTVINNVGTGVYAKGTLPLGISNSTIGSNGKKGVYGDQVPLDVDGCNVLGNGEEGIYVYIGLSGYMELEIVNTVVSGNTFDGIYSTYLRSSDISNCTVVSNDGYGINTPNPHGIPIKNCIVWDNLDDDVIAGCSAIYSCVEDDVAGHFNFSVDPDFAGAATGNYHLNTTSYCIDAGDPADDYSQEPTDALNYCINVGAYGNTSEAALTTIAYDSDNDGIRDAWELLNWPNDPVTAHGSNIDSDNDGYSDLVEYLFDYDPKATTTADFEMRAIIKQTGTNPLTENCSVDIDVYSNEDTTDFDVKLKPTSFVGLDASNEIVNYETCWGNIINSTCDDHIIWRWPVDSSTVFTAGEMVPISWSLVDDSGLYVRPDYFDIRVEAESVDTPGVIDEYSSGQVGSLTGANDGYTVGKGSFEPYRNIPVVINLFQATNDYYKQVFRIQESGTGDFVAKALENRLISPSTTNVWWYGHYIDNGVRKIWNPEEVTGLDLKGNYNLSVPEGEIFVYYDPPLTNIRCNPYRIIPANNEVITISYDLTYDSNVTIEITDPDGNHFATLLDSEPQLAGHKEIVWHGKVTEFGEGTIGPNNPESNDVDDGKIWTGENLYPSTEGVYMINVGVDNTHPDEHLHGAIQVYN